MFSRFFTRQTSSFVHRAPNPNIFIQSETCFRRYCEKKEDKGNETVSGTLHEWYSSLEASLFDPVSSLLTRIHTYNQSNNQYIIILQQNRNTSR